MGNKTYIINTAHFCLNCFIPAELEIDIWFNRIETLLTDKRVQTLFSDSYAMLIPTQDPHEILLSIQY